MSGRLGIAVCVAFAWATVPHEAAFSLAVHEAPENRLFLILKHGNATYPITLGPEDSKQIRDGLACVIPPVALASRAVEGR